MAIKLSAAQVRVLSENSFEQRLIDILADTAPDARTTLASPEGRDMLHRQEARARAHGMTSELDIARYVITAWLLGPDFDTRFPAMAQVLAPNQLTASQKAEAIERICTTVLDDLARGRA